jgi:flagellar biosynthesis/type III secretory pathway M-ring protein FliF/YscJ
MTQREDLLFITGGSQMKDKAPKKTPQKQTQPKTKEDAIREMVEKDPEKAAAILREILGKK